jgi:hypothetical protein
MSTKMHAAYAYSTPHAKLEIQAAKVQTKPNISFMVKQERHMQPVICIVARLQP